jgi:2'-5' RNA ligase
LRYREVQAQLRAHLVDPSIVFPAEPHVTLVGYKPGTDTTALAGVVGSWAATVGPLAIEVGGPVAWFPPPFQILVMTVQRTRELFDALVAIREAGGRAGFPLATVTPPENWMFHMTIATCTALDAPAWTNAQQIAASCGVTAPVQWMARAAELVVFEDGREANGGVFALDSSAA